MQAKFFKKFSVLCSCKRKSGGAEAVLEDVKTLLRSLPLSILMAPLCSSAVVREWARANSVLEEEEWGSLCDMLQDVGVEEILGWLWMELKEYQSMDRCVCVCTRACVCVLHANVLVCYISIVCLKERGCVVLVYVQFGRYEHVHNTCI